MAPHLIRELGISPYNGKEVLVPITKFESLMKGYVRLYTKRRTLVLESTWVSLKMELEKEQSKFFTTMSAEEILEKRPRIEIIARAKDIICFLLFIRII